MRKKEENCNFNYNLHCKFTWQKIKLLCSRRMAASAAAADAVATTMGRQLELLCNTGRTLRQTPFTIAQS